MTGTVSVVIFIAFSYQTCFLDTRPDSYMNNCLDIILSCWEEKVCIIADISKMHDSIYLKKLEQRCHQFLQENLDHSLIQIQTFMLYCNWIFRSHWLQQSNWIHLTDYQVVLWLIITSFSANGSASMSGWTECIHVAHQKSLSSWHATLRPYCQKPDSTSSTDNSLEIQTLKWVLMIMQNRN